MSNCEKKELTLKVIFVCFLFFPSMSFAYDINSYIQKVLSVSNEIKKYEEDLEISKKEYASSLLSLYFPEIYYTLKNTPYSDSQKKIEIKDKNFESVLSLNYNLFNNFKDKISKDASYLAMKLVEDNLWLKKQELAYDAMELFCSALKNEKLLEVMKANEKSYEEEYIRSQQYYKTGLRSYSDLLKSELNYKNAMLSTLFYENNYKNAIMSLSYKIYEDPLTELSLVPIKDISFPQLPELEKAVDIALANRREIKTYQTMMELKMKEYKKKKIALWPDLKADFSYSDYEIFSLGPSVSAPSYYLKLSLSFPLGHSFYDRHKEALEYKYYLNRAGRDLFALKLQIKKEVAENARAYRYALKKYDVSRTNVEISGSNLEIIKTKYAQGNISIIDFIEAQKDDLQAKSNMAESFYDLYLAYYAYKKSIGEQLW